MEKRLRNYLKLMQEQSQLTLSEETKSRLRDDLLIQIGFFQHERLIHLIVTVTFALLTVMTLFTCLFYQSIGLYLLMLMLLVLLLPYIRHYYILENGVQKLYRYYDELSK